MDAYVFLEHGAHYAIGALAFIMLASGTGLHVPEVVTGLIGVAFIVWAVIASIQYKNIKPLKADCFKPWKSAAQAALFVFQIRKAFIKHKIHAASRIE